MSNVNSSTISYRGTGGDVTAYLVRPHSASGPRPAVIVIHAIFGLNDHIRRVADRVAALGYVALAPHLYSYGELAEIFAPGNVMTGMKFMQGLDPAKRGDPSYIQQKLSEVPQESREGVSRMMGKMFSGMPMEQLRDDLVPAAAYLESQSYVTKGKVGSVGFCMGGSLSISLACRRPISACVLFYGQNPSPIEEVERIQGPVMGLYGAEDMRVNADLDKLVAAMVKYKKDFQMKTYPGAAHEFFNDTNPMSYREAAAKDAWERVGAFYSKALG